MILFNEKLLHIKSFILTLHIEKGVVKLPMKNSLVKSSLVFV